MNCKKRSVTTRETPKFPLVKYGFFHLTFVGSLISGVFDSGGDWAQFHLFSVLHDPLT